MHIETVRLRLRSWSESDRDSFAGLNADPIVMADLGGPLSRDLSDAKFDRYVEAYKRNGYGRWLVETHAGRFLGYCGVMLASGDHPIGPHHEIGWRLHQSVWGRGYATEAARAALEDAFRRARLQEVLAYTAADNLRSQAVMERLRLIRDESRDFSIYPSRTGTWRGLVWSATPALFSQSAASIVAHGTMGPAQQRRCR
jgi:RimJ/RimL family protein N-acetyltransferase